MKLRISLPVRLLAGFVSVFGMLAPALVKGAETHSGMIVPFLNDHCLRCHGPEKEKGDFRVDTELPDNFRDLAAVEKWKEVVNMLNGHDMPPKKEPQPAATEVAKVVEWITGQLVKADMARRDGAMVLRRMNRDEYRNTIRDLVGVDWDVSAFPADPLADGFDNNGKALTMSPTQMEMYVDAAGKILDRALDQSPPAPQTHWRFQPEEGDGDDHRVRLDPKNNAISHGGKNLKRDGLTVMHHSSWDRNINARDYRLPAEGVYRIRLRAAGRVPSREDVVAGARRALEQRIAKEKNPKNAEYQRNNLERDLDHFKTDRMYDYGPPRLKLTVELNGQPKVIAEFDIPSRDGTFIEQEFLARFTTEKAGVTFEYAYSIPSVLENFWMQGNDDFARTEALVDWFEIEGPLPSEASKAGQGVLQGDLPGKPERERAQSILTTLMPKAYRRPIDPAELASKLTLFDAAFAGNKDFFAALKPALIAVLASPHFLFLAEPAAAGGRKLNDHELASRLSYFLWSSMPDAGLFKLAAAGKLREPKTLVAQVRRMLKEPKSEAFIGNFAGQWLGLREIGANPPAADLYPAYDRHLEMSIAQESREFFAEMLRQRLPLTNFVKSDFVVINERLGRFYGITDVRGDQFRRVSLPAGVPRGGLLTQASMLSITSNGTRTSPVKRGTWILKNIVGQDPGLPVANVGDIKPKVPGINKATVRQRLEIHRELTQCARCHDKIDPLGLALENFNAAGEWRLQEGFGYKGRIDKNDPAIDASATMPDGSVFNGVSGLQEQLLKNPDLFVTCLVRKLFTYALGRELGYADLPELDRVVAALKKQGPTLPDLIEAVVLSEAFVTK